MLFVILSAMLSAQAAPTVATCVYTNLTASERAVMGREMLAHHTASEATVTAQVKAADACGHGRRLSAERAFHAIGAATMRAVADAVGQKIGHPEWVPLADRAVRARSADQRQILIRVGMPEAEFMSLLATMSREDKEFAAGQAMSPDTRQSFGTMIKALVMSVGEEEKADAA